MAQTKKSSPGNCYVHPLKTGYPNRDDAKPMTKAMAQAGQSTLTILCAGCGQWHIIREGEKK